MTECCDKKYEKASSSDSERCRPAELVLNTGKLDGAEQHYDGKKEINRAQTEPKSVELRTSSEKQKCKEHEPSTNRDPIQTVPLCQSPTSKDSVQPSLNDDRTNLLDDIRNFDETLLKHVEMKEQVQFQFSDPLPISGCGYCCRRKLADDSSDDEDDDDDDDDDDWDD